MKATTRTIRISQLILRRLSVALAIGATLAAIGACSMEKPQSPTWDAQFTIPLVNHNYDMLELVDRMAEDALGYDEEGNISFSVEEDFDTVAVDAGLSLDNMTTGFDETLGLIEITGPQPVTDEILLADYLALSGDIPAMAIDAGAPLPTIDDVESATITSGSMVISATNDFDLPLDTVLVTITDDLYSQEIGSVTFEGGLAVGESKSETIDLSGKTISNSFSYNAHMYTPGGTILTVAEKSVSVEAGFSGTISVSSATAKVPAQTRDYDQSVSFADDNQITNAAIRNGNLNLNITNSTNLSAQIEVTVEQFTNGGSPLNFSVDVSPQQVGVVSRNLSGHGFTPLSGESQPTMNVNLIVDLPGSGSNTVEVSSTDFFSIDVQASGLEFSSVSGIIAPTVVEIDPITEVVDIPNGFDNFNLTSAVLTLELTSAVNLPGELNVHLEGNNGQQLDINESITGGTVTSPGITTIVVDNLGNFLNPIPSEISITGSATVGDGVTPGGVTENDFVVGSFEISSPLQMSVGETEFEADVNKADLDSDDLDEITDRLNSGRAYTHVANHLPLGASITLYLSGDSLTVYDDPELTIGPLQVSAGVVGTGGLVVDSVGSDAIVELTREDLQILNNETLYIGQIISFPGTDGQSVSILSTDYLDIQAYITVNTRMGDF